MIYMAFPGSVSWPRISAPQTPHRGEQWSKSQISACRCLFHGHTSDPSSPREVPGSLASSGVGGGSILKRLGDPHEPKPELAEDASC